MFAQLMSPSPPPPPARDHSVADGLAFNAVWNAGMLQVLLLLLLLLLHCLHTSRAHCYRRRIWQLPPRAKRRNMSRC